MTLIATAGASDANSYCTKAEGDAYHETHLYASVWTAATDQKKETALIMATRILDEQMDWAGLMASTTQALRWPRSGALDRDRQQFFDPATIPTFLKNATAELARQLMTEDRTKERSVGISSVTADTVEVVFDKTDVKPVLPPAVRAMVQAYGTLQGPGSGVVKLVRA